MLFQKKDSSYYGSESYRHVDKLIGSGKEVLIISPYIDGYYARMIKSKAAGRRFYIISSSPTDEAARILGGGRSIKFTVGISIALIAANYLFFMFGILSILFIAVSAALIAASVLYYLRKEPQRIWLKRPKGFVHAKMYLNEFMEVEGSANLTYSGMHKNFEHIDVSYQQEKIKRLRNQFWNTWKSF